MALRKLLDGQVIGFLAAVQEHDQPDQRQQWQTPGDLRALMGWTRLDKGGKTGKEENLLLTPFDHHSFEFRGVLFQHCWKICFI